MKHSSMHLISIYKTTQAMCAPSHKLVPSVSSGYYAIMAIMVVLVILVIMVAR